MKGNELILLRNENKELRKDNKRLKLKVNELIESRKEIIKETLDTLLDLTKRKDEFIKEFQDTMKDPEKMKEILKGRETPKKEEGFFTKLYKEVKKAMKPKEEMSRFPPYPVRGEPPKHFDVWGKCSNEREIK